MMDRRQALKNIGLSFGAVTMSSTLIGALQSCQSKTGWIPQFLSPQEADTLAQIMDVILPSSEALPGASDLHLIQFADTYLSLTKSPEEKASIQQGIKSFMEVTLADNQKNNWKSITENELQAQLSKYLKASDTKREQWWEAIHQAEKEAQASGVFPSLAAEPLAYVLVSEVRELTVNAYKNSEYIGENVLVYVPVPGKHVGIVDLQETTQGISWSNLRD